jgi:hypothetical protein
MNKTIINKLVSKALITLSLLLIVSSSGAYALPINNLASAASSAACSTLTTLDNTQDCSTGGSGVTNVVSKAVNILSLAVGIAAIIMVIVSGLKYITSGGDSTKAGSAKNTLIYALIGVAIAALAQLLVHFVLTNASNATG